MSSVGSAPGRVIRGHRRRDRGIDPREAPQQLSDEKLRLADVATQGGRLRLARMPICCFGFGPSQSWRHVAQLVTQRSDKNLGLSDVGIGHTKHHGSYDRPPRANELLARTPNPACAGFRWLCPSRAGFGLHEPAIPCRVGREDISRAEPTTESPTLKVVSTKQLPQESWPNAWLTAPYRNADAIPSRRGQNLRRIR